MQPIVSDTHNIIRSDDPLATPNPVYETVPRPPRTRAMTVPPHTERKDSNSTPIVQSPPSPYVTPSRTASDTSTSAKKLSIDTTDNVNVEASSTVIPKAQSTNTKTDQDIIIVMQSESPIKIQPTLSSKRSDERPSESVDESAVVGSQTVLWPVRNYRSSYGHRGSSYSEPIQEVHSYFYYTIVAAIVVGLCLNFVALLVCFLPALWFANKVSMNMIQ